MFIRVGYEITVECPAETPFILALSPHPTYPGRVIGSAGVRSDPPVAMDQFEDAFGNRRTRLQAPAGALTLWSDFIVENDGRPDAVDWRARQTDIAELPPQALDFLAASRYCESDELVGDAWKLFGHTKPGWPRVQAICDWVHAHLTFGYSFGSSTKTAVDAFREGRGVCRDFAHLSIALCRAMNIPARYVSGFLGDIGVARTGPGDFCAWFEVFLDGRWRSFDARYNTPRIGRVLMVYGRDAADGAMITSFGPHTLKLFRVWADEVPGPVSESRLLQRLETRPDAEALVAPAA